MQALCKTIIKKKILLNIVLDSYATSDKIFKYIHTALAITAPTIGFIDQIVGHSIDPNGTVILVCSGLVACMVRAKDFLAYDKIKDQTKQQLVKYNSLLQRILVNADKSPESKIPEDILLNEVRSQFTQLELSDPDISRKLYLRYKKYCLDNGVVVEDDIQELKSIEVERVIDVGAASHDSAKKEFKTQVASYTTSTDLAYALSRYNELT